jgi:hypothetical protein
MNLLIPAIVAFEACALVALVVTAFRSERHRRSAVIALGALTPFVVFHVGAAISFMQDPTDSSNRFAFFAGWMMLFVPFLACLALAPVVALLPKPKSHLLSYFLGLGLTLLAYQGVLVLGRP